MAKVTADSRMNLYCHNDDGTLPWDLLDSDWTYIGTSSTQGFRGGTIRFALDHLYTGAGRDHDIDSFYYSANGTVELPAVATGDTGKDLLVLGEL